MEALCLHTQIHFIRGYILIANFCSNIHGFLMRYAILKEEEIKKYIILRIIYKHDIINLRMHVINLETVNITVLQLYEQKKIYVNVYIYT